MTFDYSQTVVSPQAITFGDVVYTDIPLAQSDVKSVVVLTGTGSQPYQLGGTADSEE